MPKLYFYDTGLAISLLGLENETQLALHPFRGSLFENMIIVEFLKKQTNAGKSHNLYFWRDNIGNEVDLLIKSGNKLLPIEIKSGKTVTNEYFRGILFWNKITQTSGGYIVYGGDMMQNRSDEIKVLPFRDLNQVGLS
jgi:hypothetical protein